MKKLFTLLTLSAVCLVALPSLSQAQDAKPPAGGGRGGNRLEMLKESLSLTPEQVEKIKPLMEASRAKMQAVRDDASLSDEQKRAKTKELSEASTAETMALLTPEQQTKFKEERAKWQAARDARAAADKK